ncbi:MAG: hypothetical protein AB9903_14210 [Vulcanimicrobiota bacterium]
MFEQGSYEFINDRLFFCSFKPHECSFCNETEFHKHGSYTRKFFTFKNGKPATAMLHNRRWQCIICEHTMSITPPHLIRRIHACTLAIFTVLWIYLNSESGFEKCDFGELGEATNRSTFFRYLGRAKKNALFILQILREVVIENIVPEAWESLTLKGLSPPEHAKLETKENALLWESFHVATEGSQHSDKSLSILLARAHERSTYYHRPFLIEIQ